MLRNAGRNSTLLFRDLYALSTNSLMQSGHVVFKRETASNSPQAFVADDTKHASNGPNSVKVLYDGECNICMHEIRILQMLARKRLVDFIDINKPSFTAETFSGVTYEMAMKEMHVIGADGTVYVQGDAIREMYRACGLGWLATATQLPGIKGVCDKMYVKFAHYRLQKALDRCDSGATCSIKLKHLRDKLRPHKE